MQVDDAAVLIQVEFARTRKAELVAVFVGDLTDPPAGPADAALRRLL